MIHKTWISRIVIFLFMVLVGFSLKNAFSSGSFIAILLATVSLCAGIYFVHILQKIKAEANRENAV